MAILISWNLVAFLLGLAGLLAVVAYLETQQARRRRQEIIAAAEGARRKGTHKALSQHPIISELECVGCSLCVRACPEDQVLEVVDGTAMVVHGSRCIGHGLCAEACPVGAIQIGLGDLSERPDIPQLSESFESSVPGLFVIGELSGIALIRNAIEHGVRAAQEVVDRRSEKADGAALPGSPEMLDLLIVGAGPAGLAAALESRRGGLHYQVIEQDQVGGTVRHYPRQKLVMTQPVTLPLYGELRRREYSKEELEAVFQEILETFELPIRSGVRLESVTRIPGGFVAGTNRGEIQARHLLLALGRRGTPRKLEVPGEDLRKVSYRLVDAALYQDSSILVVGGGDSAIEAALALAAQPRNQVTLSYRREGFFRIKARNEERIEQAARDGTIQLLLSSQVEEIHEKSVRVRQDAGTIELDNDYVFVLIGGLPPYPLLRQAGIRFGNEARATAGV